MDDRRPSTSRRTSQPLQQQHEETVTEAPQLPALRVSEDEWSTGTLGIADGMQPSGIERSSSRRRRTRPSTPERGSANVGASLERGDAGREMSSASPIPQKTMSNASSRAEGSQRISSAAMSTSTSTMPNRNESLSTVSSFHVPHAMSPVQASAAPAHPYGMYPQGTDLGRSASIATTSTVRPPERALSPPGASQSHPQHPYAMYPQSVFPENESEGSGVQPPAPIPVGFPGMSSAYHRRLGPEGEEADIIGSDGHTEQLPPYTRYPTDVPVKSPTSQQPAAAPSTMAPVPPINTQASSFSQDSLNTPDSRQSSRSMVSESSGARLNTAAPGTGGAAEHNSQIKEKWAETKKKRYCGGVIPLWAIILAVVLLVIVCTVVGGVVGATVARNHHKPPTPVKRPQDLDVSPTASVVTVTKDYSPLPTLPPNLPQLPVGNFSMLLPWPSEHENSCVSDTEPDAWSCLVPPNSGLTLQVLPVDGEQSNRFQLLSEDKPDTLQFGMQPPLMNKNMMFSPVMDNEDRNRGPAYFFQLSYNKTVILSADKINVPSKARRAAAASISSPSYAGHGSQRLSNSEPFGTRQMSQVNPGDQPWFCMWNNTILQGFVYLTLNSSGSLNPTTQTVAPSSTINNPTASPEPQVKYPRYPKVIKFDESRNTSAADYARPYCQQMQLLDDLSVTPAIDSNGNHIVVFLDEFGSHDTVQSSSLARSSLPTASVGNYEEHEYAHWREKRVNNGACHCQWELL